MFILTSQLSDKNADICIDSYPFLIGRKELCFEKIQTHFPHIADLISFLSKQHASFDLDDGQLTIVDLGSINGTKVNGHPIGSQKVVLRHGDRISFAEQLHYTLVDTEQTGVEEIPLLTLEPVDRNLGLSTISIKESSFTIGRNIPAFSSVPERFKGETQNISRQHCTVQWQGNAFYIKDLGSTNGTKVDDILLGANETVALQNGMRIIFSPQLTYEVRVASSKQSKHKDKDDTRILSADNVALSDSAVASENSLNQHTVYMKDATSFLSYITDESTQESTKEEAPAEETKKWSAAKGLSWRNALSLKIISVSIAIFATLIIGYYLYNQSDKRQVRVLFKAGQYEQAAGLAQEILSGKPGNREVEKLLFESIAKEYLVDWAVAVRNEQSAEARELLNKAQRFADGNQEISSLLQFLLLLTDLAENIPVESLDKLTIDINLAGRYTSILTQWNQSKLDNRAFLERLLQVDAVFSEIQETVFRKLNLLEILVSQQLRGVDDLQKDVGFYLISSQPDQIKTLLESFSRKYPNVRGVESFHADLKAYLEITELIQRHDSIALLEKASTFQPATSPFREHMPNLLLMVPAREELQAFADGELAWLRGDVDRAVNLLEQVKTGTWSEYAQNRIDHFLQISDLYRQLEDNPASPDYSTRLVELRERLEESDAHFKGLIEKKLMASSNVVKANIATLTDNSIAQWNQYIESGGISASMRMEPTVSEKFRRQAMHLKKAYDLYQEANQLIRIYGLSPEAEFNDHAIRLQNEVLIQEKRMQSLRNIISIVVFKEKISLLPKG